MIKTFNHTLNLFLSKPVAIFGIPVKKIQKQGGQYGHWRTESIDFKK